MRLRAPNWVVPPARATASPIVVSGRAAKTSGRVTSPDTATRISGSMTNWGFSSYWPRKVRRLASAVANGRPATRTLRKSGWVIVPSGATTKSPLNSGLRHTSMRTESPGVSTDCALRGGRLLGEAGAGSNRTSWANARVERKRISLVARRKGDEEHQGSASRRRRKAPVEAGSMPHDAPPPRNLPRPRQESTCRQQIGLAAKPRRRCGVSGHTTCCIDSTAYRDAGSSRAATCRKANRPEGITLRPAIAPELRVRTSGRLSAAPWLASRRRP